MVPSAATTGELKTPLPVWKLHRAPPVVCGCTGLTPSWNASPRNLGHGLPDASGSGGCGEAGGGVAFELQLGAARANAQSAAAIDRAICMAPIRPRKAPA